MNPQPSDLPDDAFAGISETERIAADWVVRQAAGLSADEDRALAAWLAADPEHARVFAEMNRTDELLSGVKFAQPAPELPAAPAKSAISRRRFLGYAAGAAAAAVAGIIGLRRLHPTDDGYLTAASTARGEFKRLPLPDGSVILLNTDSAVDVAFSAAERRITLHRGEAFFTVAPNPARPFLVQAGRLVVRAVGTAFNVRLQADALSVLVTEGKVRVLDHAPGSAAAPSVVEPLLAAGQLARVPLDADRAPRPQAVTVETVAPQAMASAVAWQQGRLVFSDTSLGEVVAEFNRYHRRQIVIADASLAARKFGGAFSSHDIEPLLELLEQNFGVVAETRGDEIVIRQPR